MKIVHLVDHFYPRIGGVEKHVKEVAFAQVGLGHEVTVISGQYQEMSEYQNLDMIDIFRYPALRSPLRAWLWHLKNRRLYSNADIIHIHNISSFESVPSFLIKKGKSVLTLHGWGGKFPIPGVQKKLIRKRVRASAGKVVTVGHFVNKWYGITSDLVIYGAIDPALFNFQHQNHPRYDICIFGRLEKDAGVDVYIDALVKFVNIRKDLKICICGDGSMKSELLRKLSKAEVDFYGFIDKPELLIKNSRCCFTSGYLAILESLALSRKVFSVYDNPVKEDYLKLSPFEKDIYISGTSQDLIRQLDMFFSEGFNESMIRPEYVLDASWGNLVKSYNKLYLQLQGVNDDCL